MADTGPEPRRPARRRDLVARVWRVTVWLALDPTRPDRLYSLVKMMPSTLDRIRYEQPDLLQTLTDGSRRLSRWHLLAMVNTWLTLVNTSRAHTGEGTGPQPVVVWMHSGVAVDVLDSAGRARDGLVDYWVQRGLSRGGPQDLLEPADGWSATLDQQAGSLVVTDAGGKVALTGWFDPARDADWVNTVRDTGELVVLTGRVAPEGGTITTESLQAAVDSGDVARGTITRITIS